MSDRMSGEAEYSFDRDVPPAPSDHSRPATPERRSTRSVRRPPDSYQPRPFSSWLSRLWRTLAFRPGVYTEMMGDRHATWQAAATWAGAYVILVVVSDDLLQSALWLLLGSLIGLGLWASIVHVGSRLLSRSAAHSYGQTVRLVGFSMLPALGLVVAPLTVAPIFGLWALAMQIRGLKEGIGLTWPRATITALIPWLIFGGLLFLLLLMACAAGGC